MIVVVTGTHEQPFDRLVDAAEGLCRDGGHTVTIQFGTARRPPRCASGRDFYPFDELDALCRDARIIVTHGGPGAIWQAFAHGKIPIVMPRSSAFGEHVDDHQVRFARHLASKRRIIAVYDPDELVGAVAAYDELSEALRSPEGVAQANRDRLARDLDDWMTGASS